MCGRTSLYAALGLLEDRFDARADFAYEPRYNIAPSQDLAVIRNTTPETITQQNWGLLPSWADDPEDAPRPINARAETVAEKPMFRSAFEDRRCLVLADGFYEWQGERGSKQPYRVVREDLEPFAFAGLWERWEGNGDNDDVLETVTIITTEANEVVEPVHDRMPVMLDRGDEEIWLNGGDAETLQDVLDPYPAAELRAYPVSKRVNDPSFDDPEVVVDIGEQRGLDEFGGT